METTIKDVKIGDIIRFNYPDYMPKILALVIESVHYPDDHPEFLSILYVYIIDEQGYTFLETEDILNLEIL